MVIFRWLSIVLIVMAVMLLGADLVGTLEMKGTVVIRSLHEILVLFNYDARPGLIATFPPQIVNVIVTIIGWPGWAIFAFLGFAFAILAPSSKPYRPLPPPQPIVR